MSYKLKISNKVLKQLKKLDKNIAKLLVLEIKKNLDNIENPRKFGKELVGTKKWLWRYRFGNYRLICDIKDDELIILALEFGHRSDIYRL